MRDAEFVAAWRQLADACPWTTAFQEPEFAQAYHATYVREVTPVLVTREGAGGELRGLLALGRSRRGLVGTGGPQAEYTGWLAGSGAEDTFPGDALAAVQERFPGEEVTFGYLPPGTPLTGLLASPVAGRVVTERFERPLVPTDPWRAAGWLRQRWKGRRVKLNRLRRLGEVRFERIVEPEAVARAIARIAPIADERYLKAYGVAPFAGDPLKSAFLRAQARVPGLLHISLLWCGNRLAAAHVGNAGRGFVHVGINTFHPDFHRHSPFELLLLFMVERMGEDGDRWLDLTPGGDAYKQRFAADSDRVTSVRILPSVALRRGRDAVRATATVVRTGLRAAGIAPSQVRSLLPTAPARLAEAFFQRLSALRPERTEAREALYVQARALGLFDMARLLTGGSLRILCYHGISRVDEHEVDPYLFMRSETFAGRMRTLKSLDVPVLDLDEALRRQMDGSLPACATVVTFDDGFVSSLEAWDDYLHDAGLPATLYVATRWSGSRLPVHNCANHYMAARSPQATVSVDGLDLPVTGLLATRDPAEVTAFLRAVRTGLRGEDHAALILGRLAERLEMDLKPILADRRLSIAGPEELAARARRGLDIQLHTHTHRLADDRAAVHRELRLNREHLTPLVDRPLVHFCYPSGLWSPRTFGWLREAGVESATTCDSGLNRPATPRLSLFRFVDGDNLSDLVFEAELTGFAELLRWTRSQMQRFARSG